MLNIPNTITLSRFFFLIPFAFLIVESQYISALCVFFAGALTDMFDGLSARLLKQVTTFGKILDPIADKVFFLGAVSVLVRANLLPIWFFAIIFARDVLVVIGSFFYSKKHGLNSIKPNILGKLVNFLIFLLVTYLLLSSWIRLKIDILQLSLMSTTVLFSVLSFFIYLKRFVGTKKQN